MADVELQLQPEDARLVFLATAYHLGRPGSELDPITKQPVERGLADLARELQPQLRMAVATIHLSNDQLKRLQSAMLGSISELKTYPMLQPRDDEGRRSSVPGFDRSLRHLFPEIDEDVENSLAIAQSMLMLKRRLDERLAELPPEQPPQPQRKRGLWPFRR